jgi:hypothetical protein
MLGEVKFPFLEQRKDAIADDKVTLEDQVLSMSKDRTLRSQEGQLAGHPWKEMSWGMRVHFLSQFCTLGLCLRVPEHPQPQLKKSISN